MDSYCDYPVPDIRRKTKHRKIRSGTKYISKPKKQYLPVRGFTDDFTVVSQRGISHSPDSIAYLELPQFSVVDSQTHIEKDSEIQPVIPIIPVRKGVKWSDVVKHGVDLAEWDLIDETIFVLEI